MNFPNFEMYTYLVEGTLSDPTNIIPPKSNVLSGQFDLIKPISDIAIW